MESVRFSDSDSMKNKIILRTTQGSGGKIYRESAVPDSYTVFHVVDLNTGKISTIPRTLLDYCSGMSMVAVGSQIYIFGKQLIYDLGGNSRPKPKKGSKSEKKLHKGTSFLDLAKPDIGWRRGARVTPPHLDQCFPDCVAFGGKVYFFRDSGYSCICQVFDPQLNQWLRIKSPPARVALLLTPPILADVENNRIIVCFNISAMYAYYPSTDSWECLVEGFSGWRGRSNQVVCVDGVIYAYHPGWKTMIRAYHIATKQWLNIDVSSNFNDLAPNSDGLPLTERNHAALFHLGNALMCLLGYFHDIPLDVMVVRVVQFKVQLKLVDKEVLVTPLSAKYYPLDRVCSIIGSLPSRY